MQESLPTKILSYAAIIIAGWGIVYPKPYGLVALLHVSMPWIALWLFKLSGKQRANEDLAIQIAVAFLVLPGVALSFMARTQFHAVRWMDALWLAIAVSAIFTISILKVNGWLHGFSWLTILGLLIFLSYGYGAGMEINALLDRSVPTIYSAKVLASYSSYSRRTPSYHLELGPWGPMRFDQTISVPSSFYKS
jgi:hypothetical protein